MRLDMSGARKTVHGCGVAVVDDAVARGEGDSGGGTLAAGIGPGSGGSGLVMLGLLLEVPVPLMVWLKVPKGLEAREPVTFPKPVKELLSLSSPRFIFLFIEGTGS